MFTADKVTEIFFMADEFHNVFCRMLDKYILNTPKTVGKRRIAELHGYAWRCG